MLEIQNAFWAILLRTGQFAVEASTTLLCGFLIAGVMRRMLGAEGTRRLFGGPGWNGLLRAWGVGTLLPVCSLGVLPIAREMRRAGVRSGTILAFVLAAPHINPLSLLYGLTLSEPIVVICFAAGSLLVALAAGAVWDRLLARHEDAAPIIDEPMPAPGLKRLAAVVVTAGREATGSSMGYILLGLLLTGVVAGLLPFGCLSTTMKHNNWTSPILMAAVATPIYLGPLQGMMRLGLMFEHGNSVGAAFTLFELGIGVNLGLIVWLSRLFGWRRIVLWIAIIIGVTLTLAYSIEKPLYFAHEEVSHTHAFDDWASPFPAGTSVNWQFVRDRLAQKIEILEPVAISGLACLVVVGMVARRLDRNGMLEAYLVKAPAPTIQSTAVWNRTVPGPMLGIAALLGLVAFSVVALYIYYPDPAHAFAEIVQVRTEAETAVLTGSKDEAIRQIQYWDLLTRKLQVGVFIRSGRLNPEKAQTADDLREELESLRDALLANDLSGAKSRLPAVEAAYRKCHDSYSAGH